MSTDDAVGSVKNEIQFFMGKAFQTSFGYFGLLLAAAATLDSERVGRLSGGLGVSPSALTCGLILTVNLVYLTVALSCLFAVLKRGLWLLERGSRGDQTHAGWEVYARLVESDRVLGPLRRAARNLAWNVDNLYMLPLFALVVASSIVAAVWGCTRSTSGCEQFAIGVLAFLHVVPAAAATAMLRLNARCRRVAVSFASAGDVCAET